MWPRRSGGGSPPCRRPRELPQLREDLLHDASGRPSVVEVTATIPERGVAFGVESRDAVDVGERGRQLVHGPAQRPRRLGLEVEVEAAHLVAVVLEVIGEGEQWLTGDREVEHGRGVVGDEDVRGEVEVADVLVGGDVAHDAAGVLTSGPATRKCSRNRKRWSSPIWRASSSTSSVSVKLSAPCRTRSGQRLAQAHAVRVFTGRGRRDTPVSCRAVIRRRASSSRRGARQSMSNAGTRRPLRSQNWFDNPAEPDMTVIFLERYMNYGLTREELQAGKPIIGIAQTGNDLSPCNRHHLELAKRVREGIREAGGIAFEFPVHPIQETSRRPTAALDRNLAYLGLVEVLHGYPLDGVVLTTGCDKTTPAMLMGAATVNIPAIVLSGGPMLDGYYKGRRVGSGTIVWEARELLAAGKIDDEEFMELAAASAPSIGHCNTMGTALSMNSLAEVLGMSLPGCAAIPGPQKERGWMAYQTGKRIVAMVHENLRPSDIMTKQAFENAVVAATAIGASSNCPISMIAIARHMGVDHTLEDWQRCGADIPLLADVQPAGRWLGEAYWRAGGVPAILQELKGAGKLHLDAMTCTGKTLGENLEKPVEIDREVIRAYDKPMKERAGFAVLSGNLFAGAVMKVSVIDKAFRDRFLSDPDKPNVFEGRAIVFEGPEDYHDRLDDPSLGIDEHSILVIRNCGPVGYPGSAEVVNMQPPAALLKRGVDALPTMGDGRQSGTSGSPSILNVAPESVVGGGLALLQTGDKVRIDLNSRKVDVLIPEADLAARRKAWKAPELKNLT